VNEDLIIPKLSDSNAGISGTIGSLRAGINPAPTKRVDLPVVGAGFTPARIGCWSLQIAHFRCNYDVQSWFLIGQARIIHESAATAADMTFLPGVLGPRTLRRTVQVRLGAKPLRLPGGKVIFTVSRREFVNHPA
jgi:hypothetical protein